MTFNKNLNFTVLLIFGCLFFVLISCDKNELTPVTIDDIPANIGTKWHYSQQKRIQRFDPGSEGDLIKDTTLKGSIITRIVKDTVLNDTQPVWVFEGMNTLGMGGLFGNADFSTSYTYNYIYKDDEGLKMYAYRFSDQQLYPQFQNLKMHGAFQKKIPVDDIRVETQPPLYIQLPLNEQSAWTFRKANGSQGQINKKVTGYEFLEVGGKNHFCYRVEWEYLNNDAFAGLKTIEWFSDIGMVRMEIHHERTMLTTFEGEALGEIKMTEIIMLENYQVK